MQKKYTAIKTTGIKRRPHITTKISENITNFREATYLQLLAFYNKRLLDTPNPNYKYHQKSVERLLELASEDENCLKLLETIVEAYETASSSDTNAQKAANRIKPDLKTLQAKQKLENSIANKLQEEFAANKTFEKELRQTVTAKWSGIAQVVGLATLAFFKPNCIVRPLIAGVSQELAKWISSESEFKRHLTSVGLQGGLALLIPQLGMKQLVFALLDPILIHISHSLARRSFSSHKELQALIAETIKLTLRANLTYLMQTISPPKVYRYYDTHSQESRAGDQTIETLQQTVQRGDTVYVEGVDTHAIPPQYRNQFSRIIPLEDPEMKYFLSEDTQIQSLLDDSQTQLNALTHSWSQQQELCVPVGDVHDAFDHINSIRNGQMNTKLADLDPLDLASSHVIVGSCHELDIDKSASTAVGAPRYQSWPCYLYTNRFFDFLKRCTERGHIQQGWFKEVIDPHNQMELHPFPGVTPETGARPDGTTLAFKLLGLGKVKTD